MKITSDSVSAMHQLGAQIGAQLKSGDVIVLSGELGAGKTVLTQGIGSAFGVENITLSLIHISEPTRPY